MLRADGIKILAELFPEPLVVTTAGGATHEWWALGNNAGQIPARTLGLCSSIGLGLALALPSRRVLVLDGDGGLLMNLNSLVTSARHSPPNLVHVCFDNRVYESSGGTPTFTADGVDLAAIGRAAGIARVHRTSTLDEFRAAAEDAAGTMQHTFLLASVDPGLAAVAPIPIDEVENKYRFARYVESTEGKRILSGPTSPVTTVSASPERLDRGGA